MSLIIPAGFANEVLTRRVMPGDILGLGESLKAGAISTVGAGTWTGAAIATGIINRTGPTGGYTDTTDTSANIITALAGSAPTPDGMIGTSFRMRFINTVAQAHTLAAGVGVTLGSGSTLNASASTWRDYLFTILNASKIVTISGSVVSASAAVTFQLPNSAQVSLSIGPSSSYNQVDPGMTINSGSAGLQSGTTVLGVTQGQGGITGIVMSQTATATAVIALTFTPSVQVDSIGSGTL